MTERDYAAWLAVRSIGEAVTRTSSNDPKALRDYLRGPEFAIGAFKGEGLTFRTWNQQMRQPILLAAPRTLVSVSPQEGFCTSVRRSTRSASTSRVQLPPGVAAITNENGGI